MTTHRGSFDGVTLDVGGVFVVPRHDVLARALVAVGLLEPDTDASHRFWDAHYLAMHAVDRARSAPETFGEYVPAFCHHLGLVDGHHLAAVSALQPLFGPSGLWSEPIAESIAELRLLHEAGLPMAVVSNADGTVAEVLREAGVCQAGPGPLVPMACIVDSGQLGIAKPDPRTFQPALDALGLPANRVLHVGDSVHYDVEGARAAGMQAAHFDPRRLCESTDHHHVRSLLELLD